MLKSLRVEPLRAICADNPQAVKVFAGDPVEVVGDALHTHHLGHHKTHDDNEEQHNDDYRDGRCDRPRGVLVSDLGHGPHGQNR